MFSQTIINRLDSMREEIKLKVPVIVILTDNFTNIDEKLLGYKLLVNRFREVENSKGRMVVEPYMESQYFELNEGETSEQLHMYLTDVNRESGGNEDMLLLTEVRESPSRSCDPLQKKGRTKDPLFDR